jgi:hypothetical protein
VDDGRLESVKVVVAEFFAERAIVASASSN